MTTTRVLVVDVDPVLCGLVDDVLADVGYEVRTSSDVVSALDLVPNWRPHVIVLEPVMNAMDAESFLAACRIHEVWDTPVILLSGGKNIAGEVTRLGARDGLAKPFDIDVLSGLVGQWAQRTNHSDGIAQGLAHVR
jgi:two-component system OmpR family response regulator